MPPTHSILFVQGAGEAVHEEWDSKLVASLQRELGPGFEIHYPKMPAEEAPSYALWKPVLARAIATLPAGAILIGHSVGGTLLLNTLVEHPPVRDLRAVFVLAAPFVGNGGWPSDEMQFSPELGAKLPQGVPIHFYHGLGDTEVPP